MNKIDTKVCPISNEEKQALLSKRIRDLSLKIQGSWLESLIQELYQELEKAGISFKPQTYLSDEWGCPQDVPVIGIPFYLADPKLRLLEGQMTDIEAETESEILMYLRHEAGHAFNYAYRLYNQLEWERVFGQFSQPYREDYRALPFSASFVRHIPGWYAQKHPDEDFAETFAVWLTPDSQWQVKYEGTPAMAKLLHVDSIARRYGKKPPVIPANHLDRPIQELDMTLDTWYKACQNDHQLSITLPDIVNEDLRRLFPDTEGQPASDIFDSARAHLVRDVNYWTGIDRHILRSLLVDLRNRIRSLGLKISPDKINEQMLRISIFITALAMNHQLNGKFVNM